MKEDNEQRRSLVNKALAVKKKNADRLKNKANVTGVGVGYKIKNGKRTNQVSIRVYVSKKIPLNKLAAPDVLPKKLETFLWMSLKQNLKYNKILRFLQIIACVLIQYWVASALEKPLR